MLSRVLSRLEQVWSIDKTLVVLSIDDCGQTARAAVDGVVAEHGHHNSNLTLVTLDHRKKWFGLATYLLRKDDCECGGLA